MILDTVLLIINQKKRRKNKFLSIPQNCLILIMICMKYKLIWSADKNNFTRSKICLSEVSWQYTFSRMPQFLRRLLSVLWWDLGAPCIPRFSAGSLCSSRRADGGLECIIKARYRSWVCCSENKVFNIVSYDSVFCLINVWPSAVYFTNAPSQLFWEGKLGKPKEEIGNLNGFEYMYLSDLKIPYFLYSSSVSIKVISMGTTLSPSMARLPLP